MNKPRNSGKPWSSDADLALLLMWEAKKPTEDICAAFGRSEKAIASRLVLLDHYADLETALAELQRRRTPPVADAPMGE